MDLKFAESAIRELARIGVRTCILIGGEPTVHPRIDSIIKKGVESGLDMQMVSNGIAFASSDYAKEIADSGIKGIGISIEGSEKEIHELVRGERTFDRTLKGISNCVDLGIFRNAVMTISSRNMGEIVPLARRMKEVGVERVVYNFMIPPSVSKNPDDSTDPRLMAQAAISAHELLKAEGVSATFMGTLPLCLFGEKALEMAADDLLPLRTTCHMFSSNGIVIEPRGSVIPCTHFPGMRLFETTLDGGQSFALTGKLDKVWNESGGAMERFRDALWKYPSETCKNCKMWGKCLGGCPMLWNTFDPNEFLTGFRASN